MVKVTAGAVLWDAGKRMASAMRQDPSALAIESDRRFRFPLPRTVVWRAINRVENYPRWWPWLREFDGHALRAGDVWTCVVQPPVPYALGFALHIDEVEPGRVVTAHLRGDIEGTACLELHDRFGGCELRLVSSLAPHSPVLRAAALLARPMARYGHDWVLDTGARQFVKAAVRAATASATTSRARR